MLTHGINHHQDNAVNKTGKLRCLYMCACKHGIQSKGKIIVLRKKAKTIVKGKTYGELLTKNT